MRILFFLLVLATQTLHAQHCGGSHTLEVRMTRPVFANGRWMASAELSGRLAPYGHVDSVPGDPHLLRLTTRTGCGLDEAIWTVHDHHTANKLIVHLYHLPGDAPTMHILMPFAGYNTQHYDLRAILGCATDQRPGLHKGVADTIACRCGLGVYTALGYDARYEVLDTRPWETEPQAITVGAASEASFPGGERALELHLRSRIAKPMIEALPAAYTFQGHAMVEADGTVHEVTFSEQRHPELQHAIRRALQLGMHWQPAVEVFRNEQDTKAFRAARSAYAFRFTADPATVWVPLMMNEHDLHAPTTKESGSITLRWIGGSCGKEKHVVTVGEASGDGCTPIDVSAGIEGDMCQDIRQRSQTIPLPALTPGCYRLRIMDPPPGTTSHVGPYQYVEFTVGP